MRPRPMFRSSASFAGAAALAALATASAQAVTRFVDINSPGPIHNGSSWVFAYTDLQDALAAAVSGDQIWIANGIYKPTTTTDRTISFSIPNGVKIFGGFAGAGINESSLSQRDILANRAILSGNIGGAGPRDNSLRVVFFGAGILGATALDGVFVTAGNANGGGASNQGAGMLIAGSPTIRNCVFVGNTALSTGGAVLCLGDANFSNCVFSGNTASIGPAIDMQGAHININNCTIVNNTSTNAGGSAVRLLNDDGFDTLIRNSMLFDNSGPSGTVQSQQVSFANAGLQINRSCVAGLDGSLGGVGNIGDAPLFVDPDGTDNILGSVDDNLALKAGSAGVDAGSNSFVPPDTHDIDDDGITAEPLPFDLASNARLVEDIVNNLGVGTGPIVDMGAHEFKQPVRVICVNDNAPAGGFGTSWADAHNSLQNALIDAADIKDPALEIIYIAEGTYFPSTPAGRAATFNMISGVRIFGGFDDSGTQGALFQRQPDDHPAILSGDIGVPGSNSDNCFHVVTANGANFFGAIRPTLDGLVITGGNANGTVTNGIGAGLFASNASTADPIIRNCKFVGNLSIGVGGVAVSASGTDISVINCVFSGSSNPDSTMPAVLFGNAGTPSLINCTVANNTKGVGVGSASCLLTMSNCIVVNNGGGSELSQVAIVGTPDVNHCCIQALSGSFGGVGNISVLPTFADPNGADNIFGTPDDDYRILACSSVIDAGDTTALPADSDDLDNDGSISEAVSVDRAGLARLRNDVDVPNTGLGSGPVDMGAYEFQDRSVGPCVADCFPTSGDGHVNIDDLLTVISTWGPGNAAGDIFPPCGNGIVDIDDLLSVISAWGPCP